MFYVSLFTFVFFVALAIAEVNKEFGEFRISHAETINKSLSIERSYSSRSLFKGYFGFNWCSPLDYKLSISAEELKLFDCRVGKYLSFKKAKNSEFKNQEYKKQITKDNFYYHYDNKDLSVYFSLDGRLSHWNNPGQSPVYVIYKDGRLARLFVEKTLPQSISLGDSGQILKVGLSHTYVYKNGMLMSVSKGKKKLWQYDYDEFLNMTLWRGQSQYELMKYDSEWDRIVFFKDKHDCRFHFNYEIKKARKFILESKKCVNADPSQVLFEVLSPRLQIRAPSDILGKEFRSADSNKGEANAEIF